PIRPLIQPKVPTTIQVPANNRTACRGACTRACLKGAINEGWESSRSRKHAITMARAGNAGRMYGGSLPLDREKNSRHQPSHSRKKPRERGRMPLIASDRLNRKRASGTANTDQGKAANNRTG